MQICLTLAVSSSAVMFGSYGMGSPTNVRSLTGNPPYIGTTGNLIHSYSFLSISNIKEKKKVREEKRERLRLLHSVFFSPHHVLKLKLDCQVIQPVTQILKCVISRERVILPFIFQNLH